MALLCQRELQTWYILLVIVMMAVNTNQVIMIRYCEGQITIPVIGVAFPRTNTCIGVGLATFNFKSSVFVIVAVVRG